jgi:uncharacterized protein (TIGR02145 family)
MEKIFGIIIFIVFSFLFGCGTKDQDGNNFSTIKIDNQEWMVENLNVEHYRNGDIIPQVKDKDEWSNLRTGAWCYYGNDQANGNKYGKLYNWYAVNDSRGLAPEGWHIPSQVEFEKLKITINNNGNSLKAVGQGTGDGEGTNNIGFSALLAGGRDNYTNGDFFDLGSASYLWSSTEHDPEWGAYILNLSGSDNGVDLSLSGKVYGFSVRCIRD